MWSRRGFVFALLAVLLIAAPLIADKLLSARNERYERLLTMYECVREVCEADFNGDGTLGKLELVPNPKAVNEAWLLVIDNGQELMRLPARHIDGTLRTHAAIRDVSGMSRLLIFDGFGDRPFREVYSWDGQAMSQVPPSDIDLEILAAMGARDETGTMNYWLFYQLLRLPCLVLYYLALGSILIYQLVRRSRYGLVKSPPRRG